VGRSSFASVLSASSQRHGPLSPGSVHGSVHGSVRGSFASPGAPRASFAVRARGFNRHNSASFAVRARGFNRHNSASFVVRARV